MYHPIVQSIDNARIFISKGLKYLIDCVPHLSNEIEKTQANSLN